MLTELGFVWEMYNPVRVKKLKSEKKLLESNSNSDYSDIKISPAEKQKLLVMDCINIKNKCCKFDMHMQNIIYFYSIFFKIYFFFGYF